MNRDVLNIESILQYCNDIEESIQIFGMDEEDFLNSTSFQYSCAFSLLQIGEIVKRLSSDLTIKHSKIEWSNIARFRDVLTHSYGKVELPAVWNVIVNDIPLLKGECKSILFELEQK